MAHGIDVAEAAAIINVALIIVQFTYPLLVTLVAVGILKRTTNAATWSVFGQMIQRSKWPFLLQTDTASGRKVDKRIRILTVLSTFAGVLLAVAAAITPLGLHSAIRSSEEAEVSFTYVKDDSAVGQATQSHSTYVANRLCGASFNTDCPGNSNGYHPFSNSSVSGVTGADDAFISTSIASNITDVFTSATDAGKSTVAGIFDIQYRSFINYNNQTKPGERENAEWIDQGRPRTQGQFRYYQQFLLEDRTRPIEGLIVSTGDAPGIGLRNHTLPPSSSFGYTWEEDILWLEPETACTDLNVTYDYTMPAPYTNDGIPNARLTDRGGFVDLPRDYPYLDLNDTQTHPQLLARSWKAAVLTNNFIVKFMNESRKDFRLNKEYYIDNYTDNFNQFGSAPPTPSKIEFSSFGSAILELDVWQPNLPGMLYDLQTDTSKFNASTIVSAETFYLDTVVKGYGGADKLNISLAGAGGGLILGAGKLVDATGQSLPADEFRLDPGTNWSQPLFACVSSVKASVKRVTFLLNGTATVSNLVIRDVQSKEYDDNADMPAWAMEKTNKEVADLTPLWGLVSDDHVNSADLSVVRAPEFYLPASSASLYGVMTAQDAVAGAKVPLGAFGSIYTSSSLSDSQDYSGATNWLLYTKWQQLASRIETTGKIVDLIWTDLMANALVSSKGVLSGRTATSSSAPAVRRRDASEEYASMPAVQYTAGIAYDWKYAIPALVFVALYLALLFLSGVMFCTTGLSFNGLRFVLNQTAAGRAMTTERYQASADVDVARTSVWARVRGDEVVRVGKHDAEHSHLIGSSQPYQAVENKGGALESTTAYSH